MSNTFIQSDLKKLIKFEAVDDESKWPKASSDKCFLLEAVNIVGHAMLGNDWTGQEINAYRWTKNPEQIRTELYRYMPVSKAPPPIRPVGSRRDYQQTDDTNKNAKPDFETKKEVETEEERKRLTDKEVALEAFRKKQFDEAQSQYELNQAAVQRLRRAADFLTNSIMDGELPVFTQHQSGVAIRKMDETKWFGTDQFERFFVWSAVVDNTSVVRDYHYSIFVDRPALMKRVENLAHGSTAISEVDLAKLSPYLRFAVHIARTNRYFSEDTNPVVEMVKRKIEAGWSEALPGIEMSQNQINALVKVVRWPENSRISAGSKGGPKK